MNLSLQLFPSEATDAPYIVMLHGLGSAATAWKPLIPFLQPQYNIITIDLPGHGKTPLNKSHPMDPRYLAKLVVKEVERQFNVTRFDLVGNSWG